MALSDLIRVLLQMPASSVGNDLPWRGKRARTYKHYVVSPDPKALAASLQELAEAQGLTALRPPQATGVAAHAQRRSPKRAPETFRSEYVRRAEQELTERGEYSSRG